MSKTISQRGGTIVADLDHTGGLTARFPAFPIPEITISETNPSVLYCAMTPNGGLNTPITIIPAGENEPDVANATTREYVCSNYELISQAYIIAATAQRKPGTSGPIIEQTVVVYQEAGATDIELGRFNVEAAATGVNPNCGFFITACTGEGDARVVSGGLTITCVADTDIEIQLWVIGRQD